jgi:transcriptional regulator with XRE-family HTH domain
MTTSQVTSFLSEIVSGQVIPEGKLAYFQERFRNRLYDLVVGEFIRQQKDNGLTQSQLAERIGKDPSRVNKWFRSPGNWTVDTISDLLLGICASELEISLSPLVEKPRNDLGPVWINQELSAYVPRYREIRGMNPENIAPTMLYYAFEPIQVSTSYESHLDDEDSNTKSGKDPRSALAETFINLDVCHERS